jgi:hypothetical protein
VLSGIGGGKVREEATDFADGADGIFECSVDLWSAPGRNSLGVKKMLTLWLDT